VWTAPCSGPTSTARERPLEVAELGIGPSAKDQSTDAT
jgi:hypothetical protein